MTSIVGRLFSANRFDSALLEQQFNIHIVSLGYTDKSQFFGDARVLISKLKENYPWWNNKGINSYILYHHSDATFTIAENAPQPVNNALRSHYSMSQKKLYIPYDQFLNYTSRLALSRKTGETNLLDNHFRFRDKKGGWLGVIIFLIPEQSFSGNRIGEEIYVEMEHLPTDAESHYYCATSLNGNYWQVLARGIGLSIGLGNEYDFVDINATPGTPTGAEGLLIDILHPNLVYLPGTTGTQANYPSKWHDLLDSTSRNTPLPVHLQAANNPPSLEMNFIDWQFSMLSNSRRIELWEGGAGFKKDVFRSSNDCIMRRKTGSVILPAKNSVDFCPVCTNILEQASAGTLNIEKTVPRTTLSSQQLRTKKIAWNTKVKRIDLIPSTSSVKTATFSAAPFSPLSQGPTASAYYQYVVEVSVNDGIKFKDIKVNDRRGNVRDVLESISYGNLSIGWSDLASPSIITYETLSFADLFANANPVAYEYEGGEYYADPNFQRAMSFHFSALKRDVEIEICITCVFRAPVADFEPGGVGKFMKIFPEVSFKWNNKVAGNTATVNNFSCDIALNAVPRHYMQGMTMPPGSLVSFFTDSNVLASDSRPGLDTFLPFVGSSAQHLDIPPVSPSWAALFDYVLPNIQAPIVNNSSGSGAITCVYGPGHTNHETDRIGYKSWSSNPSSVDVTYVNIKKYRRQGQYDNIHVHGVLGNHFEQSANTWTPNEVPLSQRVARVSAPFCGMDCVHTHWRWAILTERSCMAKAISGAGPEKAQRFRGWSHNPLSAQAHSTIGAPLIPPNQSLSVSVRNGTAPYSDTALITVLAPKLLTFSFKVHSPVMNESQVFYEFGSAWALELEPNDNEDLKNTKKAFMFDISNAWQGSLIDPQLNPTVTNNNYTYFNAIYDRIRYLHTNTPPPLLASPITPLVQQIPDGNLLTSSPPITAYITDRDFFIVGDSQRIDTI
ncbi:hypothetical protein GCM10023185_36660 [Hymenobacter saemangeumensis]|uniref:Uncharacterized protein n=1 Tax=Hymenobacter saemangeumensis TaxID=1084522 RepID=A0ABP8IR00_9BACT